MYRDDTGAFTRRAQTFRWQAIQVDGHDLGGIDKAYRRAVATTGPRMVTLPSQ
jgi:transketolase